MSNVALVPRYWASVSGGKDSLYMLNVILNNLDKYPLDGVVHFSLDIDYPFIKNVVAYMKNKCEMVGIPFYIIPTSESWFTLYKKYGFPNRRYRWCNSIYKLSVKRSFENFRAERGESCIWYIGYCVDEVKRYSKGCVNQIFPLVDMGIMERDILNWARFQPIFNDYYWINNRCGCMYCPMMSRRSMAYLALFYPDEFNKLFFLATSSEKVSGIYVFDSKYSSDSIKAVVLRKYVPRIQFELRTKYFAEPISMFDGG